MELIVISLNCKAGDLLRHLMFIVFGPCNDELNFVEICCHLRYGRNRCSLKHFHFMSFIIFYLYNITSKYLDTELQPVSNYKGTDLIILAVYFRKEENYVDRKLHSMEKVLARV